jgi:phage repressor protein C with HTH and peptisase S24 domain
MRGGSRANSGRKKKYEDSTRISVPRPLSYELTERLDYWWNEKGFRTKAIIQALDSINRQSIKKFDQAVSAGPGRTSGLGGESLNISYEEVDIYSLLISDPEKTVLITAYGDSMLGAGIHHGDILVVEQRSDSDEPPPTGKIVIASVDDEVMVKRYRLDDGKIFLDSENPDYPSIEISEESRIKINGIVRRSIRMDLSSY